MVPRVGSVGPLFPLLVVQDGLLSLSYCESDLSQRVLLEAKHFLASLASSIRSFQKRTPLYPKLVWPIEVRHRRMYTSVEKSRSTNRIVDKIVFYGGGCFFILLCTLLPAAFVY